MTVSKTKANDYETSPNRDEQIMSTGWSSRRNEEYRAYRKAWDEVPANKTMLDFPINLDIETTTRCNLKCPMCSRTIQLEEEGGDFDDFGFMSREEYASIIDQGVEHGAKAVKLNYLGEPLLHKDVIWQVQYAKEKGMLDTLMNTNASALTEKNSRALLEAGLDNMLVSIDAINPADFAIQRVGTTLGRVIDNTYRFIELRNEINPACQVRLSMVMYDDPKWQRQYDALTVMWEGLADGIARNTFVDRVFGETEFPVNPDFHCAMPFQRMFLKNNGNVTICCKDDRDELVLGNWKKQSLYDIWNSDEYVEIRQKHADGRYYEIDICKKCPIPCMT